MASRRVPSHQSHAVWASLYPLNTRDTRKFAASSTRTLPRASQHATRGKFGASRRECTCLVGSTKGTLEEIGEAPSSSFFVVLVATFFFSLPRRGRLGAQSSAVDRSDIPKLNASAPLVSTWTQERAGSAPATTILTLLRFPSAPSPPEPRSCSWRGRLAHPRATASHAPAVAVARLNLAKSAAPSLLPLRRPFPGLFGRLLWSWWIRIKSSSCTRDTAPSKTKVSPWEVTPCKSLRRPMARLCA
mmetsp:Transcript_5309/g.16022  ORF Transcript_5309/g.16022 Transcript_5309/m.16022 type:complete len:245 (-) Transcript_5309:435-1169(-)